MNNKLEVIGIDHGWSMMKTISQVFVTGVRMESAAIVAEDKGAYSADREGRMR